MISVNIRKDFAAGAAEGRDGAEAAHAAGEGFKLRAEFDAPPGITILFGASGSGKTTTVKSIAGILRPDEGHISVDGFTLFDSRRGVNRPVRERGVGLVFQNLALFPHMSALGNVEFAVHGPSGQGRRERALELMGRLGVAHVAPRRPREISGGEAQRVALARALAVRPRILLLDEPLSAIDQTTKQGIMADLKMINREMRLPVIYVTHSRDEALALGDHLVAFDRGRIAAAGEPLEIFGGPVVSNVARLTGVENIFEGVVHQRNTAAGTMTARFTDGSGFCLLEIPLGRQDRGEKVRVAIRSGDILLATKEPRSTSARNVLCGSITAIESKGFYSTVRVKSGVSWAVNVTRQAVSELGLAPGQQTWLAIKTHSCYLLDG